MTSAAMEAASPVFVLAAIRASGSGQELTQNSHLGHRLPTAALHRGFAPVISNTVTGLPRCLYDKGRRSCSTGQVRDLESGLDLLGARYLASSLGRFMSKDPGGAGASAGNPQSWNMYSYGLNNPMSYIDPSGTTTCDVNGDNCSDSVTVDGGPRNSLPIDCFFYSFLCGDGYRELGLTISAPTQTPPPPQQQPSTQPKQSFSQCMAAHANDFSIAGAVESGVNALTGTKTRLRDNLLVGALAGNSITTLLYGSAEDNAAGQLATAPTYVGWGVGSALTYGRRTSGILSLNLAGKSGLPTALSQASGAAKGVIGKAGNALGLGLSFTQKLAIDAGFTAAEVAYCAAVTRN